MQLKNQLLHIIQYHSVSLLGIAAIGFLLLVFVFPSGDIINRNQQKIAKYNQEIEQKRSTLHLLEQKITSLQKINDQGKNRLLNAQSRLTELQRKIDDRIIFSLPEKSSYPSSIQLLKQTLHKKARMLGFKNIIVELKHASESMQERSVVAHIRGAASLKIIRRYFITLLETPYVQSIQQFKIFSCKDGICLDINFVVIL